MKTKTENDPLFEYEERLIIYEAARIALADNDVFAQIADEMDLNDEKLISVRTKLEAFMRWPSK